MSSPEISCFQIFNQTTTQVIYHPLLSKYRVFKSLIKPQPPTYTNPTPQQYRVFKSLIKPQP